MGFRFRRRIPIGIGWINIGKNGINSVSLGGKGLTTNINRKGVQHTVGLPGSGLSYQTKRHPYGKSEGEGLRDGMSGLNLIVCVILFFTLIYFFG